VRSCDRIQAHPVQVGPLSRANPGREISAEEPVAWGRLGAYEAEG
jgi:hypothetical protein